MLRFQHLENLYLLIILPILIVLFVGVFWWRKNKLQKLGDEQLVSKQLLGFIPGRPTLKFVLLLVGLAAAIIGWANLQMASGMEKVQRKGVDVIIAIDVSKSMLAQDIKPDRLTRAKQLVLSMLEKMKTDRVGLIVFAGRAYLQVPLTIDYSALKMMLQNVRPDQIPTPGTMFSEALELSVNSFSKREKKYKSLVIISDGEDHDENAIAKAKEIGETGIIVHTVGVGSPEGTTIFDPTSNAMKLDEHGNVVVSKLNEEELKSIAASGKGTYSLLRNADVVAEKLVNEIDGMEQKSLGAVVYNSYSSYFQYFLVVSFVLLLVELLLPGANFKTKNA